MPPPSSSFWKFRAIDANSLKMLINKQLWFSHPSRFNDPFDTQISLADYLKEIEGTIALKHNKDFSRVAKQYMHRHERYLETRLLYCVNQQKPDFNPFEEVLMWSHYAAEHKGICIGISMHSVKPKLPTSANFVTEKEVTYGAEAFAHHTADEVSRWYSDRMFIQESGRMNDILYVTDIDIRKEYLIIAKLFDAFSFVKSRNWAYENEYRFAFDNEAAGKSSGALISFDPADLENVIFGLLTPLSDKETIMHLLASAEWAHVKVWQAKRGASIFKLEFEQIK